MQSREELFTLPSPNYIQVADKPISYSDAVIRRIGLEDIGKQFNFHYFENITVKKGMARGPANRCNHRLEQDLIDRLKQPLNHMLVVCPIQTVGYGLFTQKEIKCGDIIGLYAGEMDQSDYDDPIYAMSADESDVKAIRRGGLTRFIQHMPECNALTMKQIYQINNKHDLYQFASTVVGTHLFEAGQNLESIKVMLMELSRKSSDKNEDRELIVDDLLQRGARIACANTRFLAFKHRGVSVIFVIAMRDIQPLEQLGVSYGLPYWTQRIPILFQKQTGEISTWSDIYQFFFAKDIEFMREWCWLYHIKKYSILFSCALKRQLLDSSEFEQFTSIGIKKFLNMNVIVLQKSIAEEDEIIVPIANTKLWVSLLKRHHKISFLAEEMTPDNMKYCAIAPDVMQSMEGSRTSPRVKEYIQEANRLYPSQPRSGSRFFKQISHLSHALPSQFIAPLQCSPK